MTEVIKTNIEQDTVMIWCSDHQIIGISRETRSVVAVSDNGSLLYDTKGLGICHPQISHDGQGEESNVRYRI